MNLYLLISTIAGFLLYLAAERVILNRWISSIPLRISVTGTRGKSSLVRMLVSVMRKSGRKVLAKTTGSEAKYILPEAVEMPVPRRGITSIIEQKNLLRKAVDIGADCFIAEIMSIHPENHYIESQQILQPNSVLLTNIRLDHTDAMGNTKDEIAAVLSLDFPEEADVFVPENEIREIIQSAVRDKNGGLNVVKAGCSSPILKMMPEIEKIDFAENIELVYAFCKKLGIDDKTIAEGILEANPDPGKQAIWKIRRKGKSCFFVNGFAANDPESTLLLISKLKESFPERTDKITGLLALRGDRADRTAQWMESLKSGALDHFNRLYVTGTHSGIIDRKFKLVKRLKSKHPEQVTEELLTETADDSVIFGFGNMVGTGRELVEYWNKTGEKYGI